MFAPIFLVPTRDQIQRACDRAAEFKRYQLEHYDRECPRNSITGGDGLAAGFLLEYLMHDYYNGLFALINWPEAKDYDLRSCINGTTHECKMKRRTVLPEDYFNATVCDKNTDQNCDYYWFGSVLPDFSSAWILGFISKYRFFSLATFGKKGEIDKSSPYSWRFREDCWNVPAGKLSRPPTREKLLIAADTGVTA